MSKQRKITVAANWKMNKTLQEGVAFVQQLKEHLDSKGSSQVVLNIPFIHLSSVVNEIEYDRFFIGAQNLHDQESGAYTG